LADGSFLTLDQLERIDPVFGDGRLEQTAHMGRRSHIPQNIYSMDDVRSNIEDWVSINHHRNEVGGEEDVMDVGRKQFSW